jgi:hypothetical protein
MSATIAELQSEYEKLRSTATELAGDLLDIPRRVEILYNLYRDSLGNHAFSLIAAHGALWAWNYFETGGTLGRLMTYRYFYNSRERAYRLGLLNSFADSFREVNRLVCIDTVANYKFVAQFGDEPNAGSVIPSRLLEALRQVHSARLAGMTVPEDAKFEIFRASFHCEQEVTVAPGVKQAVAGFDCPILRYLILRPVVRFRFFPKRHYMFFKDFSDTDERIRRGMYAFQLSQAAGWNRVVESMKDYRVMPETFPESFSTASPFSSPLAS